MSAADRLALEYLRQHPVGAARRLETLTAAEAARILTRADPQVAARVLALMLPVYAAGCAASIDVDRLAAALRHSTSQQAAILLRPMAEERRSAVLGKVDIVKATALKLLLRYPETVVGAWIDADVLTFSTDLTVKDARARLRKTRRPVHDRLFILDRNRNVESSVRAVDLLVMPGDLKILEIGQPNPHTLWARVSVVEAAHFEDWAQYHQVPVINREKQFIGILSYARVRDKAESSAALRREHANPGLAEIFLAGGAGLYQTWLDLLAASGEPMEKR